MIDADKGMNLHFVSDLADTRNRIDPEIRIRILDH